MLHLIVIKHFLKSFSSFSNINEISRKRVDYPCEDGIEKSVPRLTDWHHEACHGQGHDKYSYSIFKRVVEPNTINKCA